MTFMAKGLMMILLLLAVSRLRPGTIVHSFGDSAL